MVALASVWPLQMVTLELGEDLTVDVMLALMELDAPVSTCLRHTLRLAASSFNLLSKKRRKEAAF